MDPDPNYKYITDRTYIRYTTNSKEYPEGYIMKNVFHSQSYWPEWYDGETIEFSGTKMANNGFDQSGDGSYYVLNFLDWGYVDNLPNETDQGFNIDWAVDKEGNNVELKKIDYIKVYTGVNQYCGWIGETSTEICGAEDLHPQAEVVSLNSVSEDVSRITIIRQNNSIIVRSSKNDIKAEIYNLNGTKIDQIELQQGDNFFDVTKLSSGIYLIRTNNSVEKLIL